MSYHSGANYYGAHSTEERSAHTSVNDSDKAPAVSESDAGSSYSAYSADDVSAARSEYSRVTALTGPAVATSMGTAVGSDADIISVIETMDGEGDPGSGMKASEETYSDVAG